MVARSNARWTALERWAPTLLLLGGGGVITHAAINAVEAFTALTAPPDVFVTTGHLVALVGLIGLYPALVERTPRLARFGLAVGAVAIASWVVMTVGQFLAVAGVWASLAAVLPGAFFVVVLAATILTYAAFGTATLRGGGYPRTDGLLVLAPAVLIAALAIDATVNGSTAVDGVLFGGGLALSMLALGVRLRSWTRTAVGPAPAGAVSG